jgi:hypothetical protein
MKTRKRKIWANIICHEGLEPYKVIVTDGRITSTIPVTNTKLETVKRMARELYGASEILVTQVLDRDSKTS